MAKSGILSSEETMEGAGGNNKANNSMSWKELGSRKYFLGRDADSTYQICSHKYL